MKNSMELLKEIFKMDKDLSSMDILLNLLLPLLLIARGL